MTAVRRMFSRIMHSQTALRSQWGKGWKIMRYSCTSAQKAAERFCDPSSHLVGYPVSSGFGFADTLLARIQMYPGFWSFLSVFLSA